VAHAPERLADALRASGLDGTRIDEVVADRALVARVPGLAGPAGRPVLLDLEAVRAGS
jgi:hypothetical protein